ncbi:MAG: YraN family protein [Eubacterium sp.]
MDNQTIGRLGEDFAEIFLEKHGYEILERNYRTKFGEIDIICRKSGAVRFVEVKTRTSDEFGRPSEAVGHRKRSNIKAASKIYIRDAEPNAGRFSFDVVEVTISHLKDVM